MSRASRNILIELLCTVLLATVTSAAEESLFKINMNGMDLWFDRQSGSLEYLSSPATGVLLEGTQERSGLLDVAYPTSAFTPLRLASRFSKAQVVQEGNTLTVGWETLGPSRSNFPLPEGHVSARVTVRPAQDGRTVILSCQIENHSNAPIPQVLFPDLWGLTPSNGVGNTELRLARGVVHPFTIPFRPPDSAPPYYDRVGWKEYPAERGYYSQNALRWLDFGGLGGGLSVFQRKWRTEDRPDVLTYRAEHDPMHLRLAWQHKRQIDPGQTWESGEFWLTAHPGGWAKGIEVFRDYVQQVNPPRALPTHIRNGLGFQSIWMVQAPEKDPAKAAFSYKDLPRVAADALQYGLDELVPWFWTSGYFSMPVHFSRDLGTEKELLEGIKQAETLGVNVAPFFSIHIIGAPGKYGVTPGHDDWTYHTELIPQFRPYYAHDLEGTFIDDGNPLWQQDTLRALTDWINRGMASLSFDQFSYKEAPGQKPGLIKTIEQVRTVAKSKDAQSTFGSESCTDLEWDTSILDYTWNWVDYLDAGPLVSVLRSPRLNCNIDDSPLAVKKCFAEGLYLNVMPSKEDEPNGTALISERPQLGKALRDAAAMRKQFLPYFVEGNALGESVLSEATTAFVRAYGLRGRLLLLILNDTPEPKHIAFRSDLSLWLPQAGDFEVKYFDAQGKLLRESSVAGTHFVAETDLLQPGEMGAVEVRAK
ncbi:MAG: hypothetical protein ABSF46_26440 [Terriglobia bacterium]|jgi:hypothetical protein